MTPVAVGGRRIPVGSGAVLAVALVGMLLGLQGSAVATPSVGAASSGKPVPSGTAPAASGSRPSGSAMPSPAPAPMVQVSGGATSVTYTAPTTLTVAQGTFTAVRVSADGGESQLDGTVSADGTSWTSQTPPKPASSYQVTVKSVHVSSQTADLWVNGVKYNGVGVGDTFASTFRLDSVGVDNQSGKSYVTLTFGDVAAAGKKYENQSYWFSP